MKSVVGLYDFRLYQNEKNPGIVYPEVIITGGNYRARTYDPLLVGQML